MVQINPELVKSKAITFDDYLSEISEERKLNWEKGVETVNNYQLSDKMLDFLKLPSIPLNIIIFSKEWCPECILAVAILEKFAKLNRSIRLQIIDRDECPELYSLYMPNDDERVPVVLFTSEDYYLVTSWIERPAIKFMILHEVITEMRDQGKDAAVEKLVEIIDAKEKELLQATVEELFSELARTIGALNYSTRLETVLK
ncbi:MAG: thioredoxin family protein [Candidatus Heimdallarchaeota archaeon]|nr:thioredoxin family protein [Candidatus Heimdallarchaeota archaeon]MCK5048966.1 thioredoxin family protein [Candidatus Heimdallarchaeota archaeon]